MLLLSGRGKVTDRWPAGGTALAAVRSASKVLKRPFRLSYEAYCVRRGRVIISGFGYEVGGSSGRGIEQKANRWHRRSGRTALRRLSYTAFLPTLEADIFRPQLSYNETLWICWTPGGWLPARRRARSGRPPFGRAGSPKSAFFAISDFGRFVRLVAADRAAL